MLRRRGSDQAEWDHEPGEQSSKMGRVMPAPTPGSQGSQASVLLYSGGCNNSKTVELSLCSLWVEDSAHLARGLAKNSSKKSVGRP